MTQFVCFERRTIFIINSGFFGPKLELTNAFVLSNFFLLHMRERFGSFSNPDHILLLIMELVTHKISMTSWKAFSKKSADKIKLFWKRSGSKTDSFQTVVHAVLETSKWCQIYLGFSEM